MSFIPIIATAGVNILGGYLKAKAGARAAGREAYALTFSGNMERMQISRAAQEDTRLRAMELHRILGAQQAAFGARGIAGGRSAALLPATSRVAAMREQDEADFQTRMQIQASQFRQKAGIKSARAGGRLAGQQGLLDMVGGGIDLFRGINQERERRAVTG